MSFEKVLAVRIPVPASLLVSPRKAEAVQCVSVAQPGQIPAAQLVCAQANATGASSDVSLGF